MFKEIGGVSSWVIIPIITQQQRKDTRTMKKDNVIDCEKPETFIDDPLTDILRKGARKMDSYPSS